MHRILSVLPAFLLIVPLHAQPTRVLFIGNSYTSANNLPEMTRQLALSMGDTLVVASSAPGGFTFEQHSTNATTQGLIDQGDWDFVVLQEQSQLPSFPPSQVAAQCLPFAQALVDTIRAHSPCAEPVFYMTWGRQNGDAQNCAAWPPVCTYEGMQARLRISYLQMAQDNSAECAPAGVAWKRMREDFPAVNLYGSDGNHPSVAGTYLVASTLYSTFFRASTAGASFTSSLDAATALTLRQVASSVVLDSLDTWNIGVNDPVAVPELDELGGGEVAFSEQSVNAASHFWDLGDGSTSTESSFTHTYASNGTFTVMYVAGDACGRRDTSMFEVTVGTAGIGELGVARITVYADAQGLVVRNADGEGLMELFDAVGRRMNRFPVGATGQPHLLPAPAGVIFWRFTTKAGSVCSGRVVRP